MKSVKLIIKTSSARYPIIIGPDISINLPKVLRSNSIKFQKCLIVIDKNIPNKMTSKVVKSFKGEKIFKYYFNAHEKNKNQKNVNFILNILLEKNFSRQDCLISIGGGITGDVCGFVASIFKRGLQFINVPSTLLAQVDSSIGGKTGINTKQGKNLIGSFYQPKIVLSDSKFLTSLPKREIICGYAEILKHALIKNRKFFNYLNQNVFKILNLKSPFIEKAIYESCKIKKFVVEKDENEKHLRKILNFGHTFAHAYEGAFGFSKRLNHGEAVILGMNSALKFSKQKKYIKNNDYNLIVNHLIKSKIPFSIKDFFSTKDIKKILIFMMKDKKNNSKKINLILLKKIGFPSIDGQYSINSLKFFLSQELKN